MKTNPGKLRHRITVQTRTVSNTGDGGFSESWSNDQTRWARVRPIDHREFKRGEAIEADGRFEIMMRYYAGLDSKARIVWGSRTFNITSVVLVDEINDTHIVLATEELS